MSDSAVRVAARPRKPRPHFTSYLLVLALTAFTIFAARQIGLEWRSFVDMWTNPLWDRFWPVPWDWVFSSHNVFDPLIETFQIAIIATLIGCSLALPVGFAMSKLTTPNAPVFWLTRIVMNIVRAIPDLLWGKLLVTAIGIGAFAGTWALSIFSLAVMVKLFSETVDAADPLPLEAARAAGGRHTPAVRTAVLPEVFPAYVAYALYVFELNIRASLVLGLVGAGGIGRVVETQRSTFNFDRLFGILIIMFGIIIIIEQISVAIRKRLV
jgi:phosphonate transport system permease protein